MSDEPSLYEIRRILERIDTELRDTRRDYLPREVFLSMHNALVDRVLRLEQNDVTKSTSNRNALLAMASTIVGVIVSAVIAIAAVRGGH